MDEDAPHQMRWPRVAARGVGAVVLAVAVYFLGVGPVGYVFAGRSAGPKLAFELFVAPIGWLVERDVLPRPLLWYYQWWYSLPGGPHERILRQSTPLPASQQID